MSNGVVVVDLDGTLCDCLHRVHLAQNKQWDEFHSNLVGDSVHEDVAIIISNLDENTQVIGLTGRNERYRMMTEAWLEKHNLLLETIVMRPDGNFESDHILKPRMLIELFGGIESAKERVICILDDREKVVNAFRELGFPCWQVRPERY